jgi:hypothetical protein
VTPRQAPLALTGAFLAVLVLVVLHHEPWRDEAEFWLIARTSTSVAELRDNLQYANQTRLWPGLLYGLARVTGRIEAMQLFHAALAAAAVGLFARFAPFRPFAKVLFAFGYYPLFEYGVIARAYSLGVLLTFAACVLFARRPRPYVGLGLCLFLLAQTSAFAAIVAAAFALAAAADDLIGQPRPGEVVSPWRLASLGAVAASGIALSVVQMIAPADGAFAFQWDTSTSPSALAGTARHLWRAYVPLPRPILHFWNTNVLDGGVAWPAVLGLALWAAAAWSFLARPAALVFHVAGTAALLLFAHTNHFASLRHVGHLYLLLVAAAWIASGGRRGRLGWPEGVRPPPRGLVQATGVVLLVVHMAAGVFAAGMDVVHPFSGGPAVARLLESRGYAELPLFVDPSFIAPPVVAHLGRPFYEPGSRRWGFFVVWDGRRGLERLDVPIEAQELARELAQPVVLLSNRPIGRRRAPFTRVAEIAGCIVETEQYHVYLVPLPSS